MSDEERKHLLVCLSVDDISIRKNLQVLGSRVSGYVDLGDGPQDVLATDVRVIIATSLNSDFKVPNAFFLASKPSDQSNRSYK